jgi:hypothetical protein
MTKEMRPSKVSWVVDTLATASSALSVVTF